MQVGELALAFVLSALIGLERELRQKSAGLRTYTLVGVAAALFMLVSKYGFTDVISAYRIVLDPSRVAAQIVSGIGFIGGGVIFMRRDVVRGLTTAASVWVTAAVGMACGGGLLILAVATVIGHYIVMMGFPALLARLPKPRRLANDLQISYEDGRGILRLVLIRCTELRFVIDRVRIERQGSLAEARDEVEDRSQGFEAALPREAITLSMQVKGKRPIGHLIARLMEIDGVLRVGTTGDSEGLD
ncbi:MAG TPA: MgtC/SapB family protein [Acidisoma sp.]|jgi:putative Mg2+ transporter-C (MgtC) family protein|uniref:MgtC/SapB family protein n=1 Tax=Acidisoma sp. TaxID=1872115 RepID=UPI002C4D73D5|nr:MgtC/SapB family protein [Acidisoma sp.]HTI00706.1 MgtC/SapB family protein [Acidisoma sp.]